MRGERRSACSERDRSHQAAARQRFSGISHASRLGPYAADFVASLGDQAALTVNDPWRINGWLTQLGCVREGANRYASALAAHEALVSPGRRRRLHRRAVPAPRGPGVGGTARGVDPAGRRGAGSEGRAARGVERLSRRPSGREVQEHPTHRADPDDRLPLSGRLRRSGRRHDARGDGVRRVAGVHSRSRSRRPASASTTTRPGRARRRASCWRCRRDSIRTRGRSTTCST